MTTAQVRVAVVGMSETGRGWAALCVSAGWPVALYDNEAQALNQAPDDVIKRARSLVGLGRASSGDVEEGIKTLTVGRSLLQACGEATWVIEAVRDDLRTKQKTFTGIESVAGKARVVSSSSGVFSIKDVAGQCLRQERCMVTHPQHPVELVPLVEISPSPMTDVALIELLKGWLRALRRVPVMINEQVPGFAATRIAAAVWREAIDLVLKGVIDVADLDRAVSLGPALTWAAAGPHLTFQLAAGEKDPVGYFQNLLHGFEDYWADMANWSHLEPEELQKLVHAIEKAYKDSAERLRPVRDRRLAGILRGIEHSQPAGTPNKAESGKKRDSGA